MDRIARVAVVALAVGAALPVAALAQDDAYPAAIYSGGCDERGNLVFDLSPAVSPAGEPIGSDEGISAAQSRTSLALGILDLTGTNHALRVADPDDPDTDIACGPIGGVIDAGGALVIGLAPANPGSASGIAYIAPTQGGLDVSLFVADPDASSLAAQGARDDSANAALVPEPSPTPSSEAEVDLQSAEPVSYEVADEEIIQAPNGRTRVVQRIVIAETGPTAVVGATLAEATQQALREYPEATVSVVFAYGPGDDIEGAVTRGRASVSRDGQGLDPGSDNLIIGPDDGTVQIEVVTELYDGFPVETEIFSLPAE